MAALVTAASLLVPFLDHPFPGHSGSIAPTAVEDVLDLVELEPDQEGLDVTPPCGASGHPRPA